MATTSDLAVGAAVLIKGWQPVEQRRGEVVDVTDAPMIRVRITIDGREIEIASFALEAVSA